MAGDYLSVFNATGGYLSDAQIQNAIPDWQAQLSNEFPWFWGNYAYIDFEGSGTPVIITAQPGPNDPPDALGYHYIDGNYNPYAIIFAQLSEQSGVPWTGVASHEILETCADRLTDTTDLYDYGNGTGIIVLQEVCDPVESLLYTGAVNGNPVSNFVTPAWYVPGDQNQVDLLGALSGPWELYSGGYVSYQVVQLGGWQQASADKVAEVAQRLRQRIAATGNPRTDTVRALQRAAAGNPQQQQQRQGRALPNIGSQQQRQPMGARVQAQRQGPGGMTQQRQALNLGGPRVQAPPANKVKVADTPELVARIAAASQASQAMGSGTQQPGGRPNGSD